MLIADMTEFITDRLLPKRYSRTYSINDSALYPYSCCDQEYSDSVIWYKGNPGPYLSIYTGIIRPATTTGNISNTIVRVRVDTWGNRESSENFYALSDNEEFKYTYRTFYKYIIESLTACNAISQSEFREIVRLKEQKIFQELKKTIDGLSVAE